MEFVALIQDINAVLDDVHTGVSTRDNAIHDLLRISSRAQYMEIELSEKVEVVDLVEAIIREWGVAYDL